MYNITLVINSLRWWVFRYSFSAALRDVCVCIYWPPIVMARRPPSWPSVWKGSRGSPLLLLIAMKRGKRKALRIFILHREREKAKMKRSSISLSLSLVCLWFASAGPAAETVAAMTPTGQSKSVWPCTSSNHTNKSDRENEREKGRKEARI